MKPIGFLSVFIGIATFASAAPNTVEPLEIGAAAPDFNLPGVDGKPHTLAEYADADVLAILFTCNHCPTAQAAEGRVKKIVGDLKEKSFQLVAISPNDPKSVRIDELGYAVYGDTLEEMKLHAKDQGFNFPYLYDGDTQDAANAFGALATPHIFVFDKERKLRYQGRIDDSRSLAAAAQHDARNAIEALLAGEAVPVETTRAFGCSTKWLSKKDTLAEKEAEWKKLPVTFEELDFETAKLLARNESSKLRMVNLWASWCGPCIEEFADLVLLGRQFESRGFDFVSISMNRPTEGAMVQEFLEEEHAAMPKRTAASVEKEGRTTNNYLNTLDTEKLAEALDPEWKGPIPYTILIAPGGEIVYRHTDGEIDITEVRKAIVGYLGRTYAEAK
ncbi:MAG: peroxiredoxin [Verrucomicrobiales bacterium]|jgi:peroxiredoxin